jgi:outer membrane protein TolC
LLPVVSGSASAQRSSAGGKSLGNSFRAGLDASWELDIFRRESRRPEGERGNARSERGDAGQRPGVDRGRSGGSTTSRFEEPSAAGHCQDNLETQVETLQITEWRVQAGLATSLDAEQSRAGVEQTRALLPALNTAIEQTRSCVGRPDGKPPAALTAELAASRPIPKAPTRSP